MEAISHCWRVATYQEKNIWEPVVKDVDPLQRKQRRQSLRRKDSKSAEQGTKSDVNEDVALAYVTLGQSSEKDSAR